MRARSDRHAPVPGSPAIPSSPPPISTAHPRSPDGAEVAPETPVAAHVGGLAPPAAANWLAVQRRYALAPEQVRPRLLAAGAAASPATLRADLPLFPTAGRSGAPSPTEARLLGRLDREGIRVVPFGHADYPARLAALDDAPVVLLVRGSVQALAEPAVAIVGARAATRAGRRTARRLARDLAARGLTIVSGLARGIDAEAHAGALEAGGRTVAVLASGIDRLYPPEHARLAEAIEERGALVSEMPPGTAPRREYFPLRNRIISGLSLGVVVAEARARSGSLITVRHALAQGREVFVVPGTTEGPFAVGSNRLLRDGARPVASAADVVEDLAFELGESGAPGKVGAAAPVDAGPPARAGGPVRPLVSGPGGGASSIGDGSVGRSARSEEGDPLGLRILERLADAPASTDELVAALSAPAARVGACLVELELAGRVATDRDGRVHRVWG